MLEARKRRLAGGANAALSLLLLIGLLVAVNYLANRHHLRRDFTANRFYSLSDQTRRVLAGLDREVQVIAFYRTGDPEIDPVRDLLKEYDDLSPRLSFEVVDPDRQPARARRYPHLDYGTTMVDAGDRTERVKGADEQAFTNALIKVTHNEKKKIAFLTGHGEREVTDQSEPGYSLLRSRLVDEGYDVETLNLATETRVPEGIRVLVIAGAAKELLPPERQEVSSYLDGGGSALILADPAPAASHADLLRPRGIELGNDLVVDVSGVGRLFGADEFLPMGIEYGQHPITDRFNLTTVFPQARSVRGRPDAPEGTEVVEIVLTAPASWAEANPDRRPIKLDEGDRQGPICVLAAASRSVGADSTSRAPGAGATATPPARMMRLVVAGDADFCANGYSSFGGNLDLALNAIGWLAQEEDLIAIRPRSPEDRRVQLTQAQATAVGSVLLLAMPLAVVATGVAVWWRRR